MTIRVAVADDHPLMLDALEWLFKSQPDIVLVARCTSGAEAVAALVEHRPDILLLDLKMPGKDGFEVLRARIQADVPTQVVLLTGEVTERQTLEAIRLGIRGVILKDAPTSLLLQCIRTVHGGGQWFERQAVHTALSTMLKREYGAQLVTKAGLTQREIEIVQAVATGMRNKAIAKKLHVTEGTVKVHLHNIYEKLNVRTRVELVNMVREKSLV
jgi:two-component system nitrate/nitrite response regulator NarL